MQQSALIKFAIAGQTIEFPVTQSGYSSCAYSSCFSDETRGKIRAFHRAPAPLRKTRDFVDLMMPDNSGSLHSLLLLRAIRRFQILQVCKLIIISIEFGVNAHRYIVYFRQ